MDQNAVLKVKKPLRKMLYYWMQRWDEKNGGFVRVDTFGYPLWDEDRSAVVQCRSLYGLSAGYRIIQEETVLEMAKKTYSYISEVMIDPVCCGIWSAVDKHGVPKTDEKGTYEQDFLILALSEYYAVSRDETALTLAKKVYACQQWAKGHKSGYSDYYVRDWSREVLPEFGRKRVELGCYSIDAQTHTLEAYTNLLRIWPDKKLEESCRELVMILCENAYMPGTGRIGGAFSGEWKCISQRESFGDDAEAGWFSIVAMELLHDDILKERYLHNALRLINRSLEAGYSPIYHSIADSCCGEIVDQNAVWWTMCEAANGCLVAERITDCDRYGNVAAELWDFILSNFIKEDGSWHTKLHQDGTPYLPGEVKGPALCLYHNVRAMSMLYQYLQERK